MGSRINRRHGRNLWTPMVGRFGFTLPQGNVRLGMRAAEPDIVEPMRREVKRLGKGRDECDWCCFMYHSGGSGRVEGNRTLSPLGEGPGHVASRPRILYCCTGKTSVRWNISPISSTKPK